MMEVLIDHMSALGHQQYNFLPQTIGHTKKMVFFYYSTLFPIILNMWSQDQAQKRNIMIAFHEHLTWSQALVHQSRKCVSKFQCRKFLDVNKIYHTVNRLRSFLSSCHPVYWSLSHLTNVQHHDLQVCFADNNYVM